MSPAPDSAPRKTARVEDVLVGAGTGLALLALAACGSPPPGPILSSFGASSYDITDGQTIHVTAVLSDADMGPQKAGIKGLVTNGADKVYGTFSSAMPGIFTYDISWTQLDMEKGIAFEAEEQRSYTAQFIDDYGNRIERQFTVRLHCNSDPACEGRCVKLGAACPNSKTLQCLSGVCGIGCVIGNRGYLDGVQNPENTCQSCNVAQSKSSFSTAAPYTACAPGRSCSSSGKCTESFRRRESTDYSIDQIIAPAPGVLLAVTNNTFGPTLTAMASAFSSGDKLLSAPVTGLGRLHAVDPNTIFRLTQSALEVSTSGGRGFTPLRTRSGYADALWASSPTDIWYSMSGNPPVNTYAHFHSTNGSTFTTLSGVNGVADYIFGTSASNVFFLERFSTTIFRTTNAGASFTRNSYSLPGSVTVMWGTGPSDLYLGTEAGLYHSVNNGDTLIKVTPPADSLYTNEPIVGIHGCSASDVFIANPFEIWHTTDGVKATLVTRYEFGTTGADYGWHSVACTAPGKVVAGGAAEGKALIIESL